MALNLIKSFFKKYTLVFHNSANSKAELLKHCVIHNDMEVLKFLLENNQNLYQHRATSRGVIIFPLRSVADVLKLAINEENQEAFDYIVNYYDFATLGENIWKSLVTVAIDKHNIKDLERIMKLNPRHLSEQNMDWALRLVQRATNARQAKNVLPVLNDQAFSNLILGHFLSKNNIALKGNAEITNAINNGEIGQALVNEWVEAYENLLAGDPNPLRNLIFPNRKKDNEWKFAGFPSGPAVPMELIGRTLRTLFQQRYIRPLVLFLVQQKWEKEYALELLRSMNL